MKICKRIPLVMLLVIVLTISAAATISRLNTSGYTNLKVLPRNISSKELQGIMTDDFEDGLGVTCGYCHERAKDGHGLNFASDAKPEKEISRRMIRMTLELNKRWMKIKHARIGDAGLVIQCTTCHKGQAIPEGSAPN